MRRLHIIYLLFLTASFLVTSCAEEELDAPQEKPAAPSGINSYILASMPQAKASISDDFVKLSWTEDDTLSVYTSEGRFVDYIYDCETGDGIVRFKGELAAGESVGRYAVFPKGDHAVIDGHLYVNLPDEYEYEPGRVRPAMMSEIASADEVVTFSHLGGMMVFDVKGLPAGASSFCFSTSRQITGRFRVQDDEISIVGQEKTDGVTFNFSPLDIVEDMKFFVPVPVGEYAGFTVTVMGEEGLLATKTSSSSNLIRRTGLKKFNFAASDIVYVTVDGSGDRTGESWEHAKTLTSALADAEDGQVIRMAGGTYVPDTLLEGAEDSADEHKTFLVKKNLTIQGSYNAATSDVDTSATPTVISGKISDKVKAYHAMVVASPTEGTVVLKGLTFSGGSQRLVNTDDQVAAAPSVTTSDGIVVSDYRGGGLYLGSDAIVSSCLIQDNVSAFHTKTNGSVGTGLYVANGVKAKVMSTTLRGNKGGACGGAIYVHGKIELKDCLLEENSSSHSGAVHNGGTVMADGCVFRGNMATGGFAGAFRHQGGQAIISNTSFVGNTATNHGGAIQNNRASLTLTGCHFEGNTTALDGGAIANWGGANMTATSCSFVANSAANGGAVTNMVNAATDSPSSITLSKCVFSGNPQSDEADAQYGGAIVNSGSVATVSGCTFKDLSATYGGAVANKISKTLVPELTVEKGTVFSDNNAVYGGAVANLAAEATIRGCDFVRNSASGHAGAVYNSSVADNDQKGAAVVDIASSDFLENISAGNGGAIMNWYAETAAADLAAPVMTVRNSRFIGNMISPTSSGSAGYIQQGGAIANQCSVLTVAESTFSGNHAAHAGAIYSYDYAKNEETALSDKIAYTYVYNTLFDGNSVDLTANSSAQGTDIRSHGLSMNIVVNSTFTKGNSPTGSIRLRTGATCWLVSCTFTENASGPYNQSSVMKLYNTISFANTKQSYNYYANKADSEDYFQSSFIGSMSMAGKYSTTGNYLYDAAGNKTAETVSVSPFGTYKDGVCPVIGEPAVSSGMTTTELSALAASIKSFMPALETKYFVWDQKGSPRKENEKVMGAYIGDVYMDPNRYGYLNNTELMEENNLRGLITDDSGSPISGVAVSDGYEVVVTDANGVYQFAAHPDARILSVSIPAEYEIPYKANRPDFYVYIDPSDYEIRNDFTLKRRTSSAEEFTIFSLADTHVRTAEHYERFSTETMADLENLVASGSYSPNSFAVILGDIMFDSYEQVENVKSSLHTSAVPVFPCFGNHDCSSSVGSSELDLISKYQQHFGPVDYSFNIGKAHVVFMKDMIYEGHDSYGVEGNAYEQGISDHQLEWLKKDLAAVQDKDEKLIIMCVHIPLRGSFNTSKNYKEVVRQMLQFREAHVLSGHHHGVYNHIPATDVTVGGKSLYDHNQVAAAGAWWRSHLNPDGCPNGYMIYNISGNTITDYTLKGTSQDVGCQMRVYDGGVTYSAPHPVWEYSNWTERYAWSDLGTDLTGKFVVHVFNADTRDWKVNFVQNGVSVPMTRTTAAWYDMASYAFASYYTDWSSGGAQRYSTKVENTNFWYIDAPSGNPSSEKDWYVEAVHTVNGKKMRYTSSVLHDKFTGFAY